MGNTIDLHDVDVKDFIRTVESCKGNVYLETGEGDRFNLKSKLSQIMGLTKLIRAASLWTQRFVARSRKTNPSWFASTCSVKCRRAEAPAPLAAQRKNDRKVLQIKHGTARWQSRF